ncbi:manganese catalase family protein, partial [Brachybacterium muris]|nr:manganese catalase family protein [Brachybacterium muris]
APMPEPTRPDPRLYGTTDKPNPLEKVAGTVKDALHKQ